MINFEYKDWESGEVLKFDTSSIDPKALPEKVLNELCGYINGLYINYINMMQDSIILLQQELVQTKEEFDFKKEYYELENKKADLEKERFERFLSLENEKIELQIAANAKLDLIANNLWKS
jgi:hypothetical protein